MFRNIHLMISSADTNEDASQSHSEARGTEMARLTKNFEFCSIKELIEYDSEAEIILAPTTDTLEKALHNIKNNKYMDLLVVVCGKEFRVHYDILALYSKRILEYKLNSIAVFNSPELSPYGFEVVYAWMKSDKNVVFSGDLVDILRAAKFLEVPRLVDSCWRALKKPLFNEFMAFEVIFETRDYTDMGNLSELMATKISTCILLLLLSSEFVLINMEQAMRLIQSNCLAVNAEIEVFYGAIIWLDHLWPARKVHVFTLLKNIRFGFLSMALLYKLKQKEKGCLGPFDHIVEAIHEYPELIKAIYNGIVYNTILSISQGNENSLKNKLNHHKISLMEARRWMWDETCSYHSKVQKHFPNRGEISYDMVWEYLESWQKYDLNYEKTMHFADEIKSEETREEHA